ncbi:MAG: redoxin domain-containing protein [Flavobacteriales bacterium]|nr:redoxin domain-containing protein [Flavobacteriales bacterium]
MHKLFVLTFPLILASGCLNRVQVGPVSFPVNQPRPMPKSSFFELSATDINGELVKLERYKGQKVMVVNTASECGFTPQYKQLQELYETYKDKGFVVLGVPSNDFGDQDQAPKRRRQLLPEELRRHLPSDEQGAYEGAGTTRRVSVAR